jgi:hypothetical protein
MMRRRRRRRSRRRRKSWRGEDESRVRGGVRRGRRQRLHW